MCYSSISFSLSLIGYELFLIVCRLLLLFSFFLHEEKETRAEPLSSHHSRLERSKEQNPFGTYSARQTMVLQLTLSCALNASQSGPTLVHSTGVQDYKIPPEIVGRRDTSGSTFSFRFRFEFYKRIYRTTVCPMTIRVFCAKTRLNES